MGFIITLLKNAVFLNILFFRAFTEAALQSPKIFVYFRKAVALAHVPPVCATILTLVDLKNV
jgi:hypothetical protein